jgi:hypothetical protein
MIQQGSLFEVPLLLFDPPDDARPVPAGVINL